MMGLFLVILFVVVCTGGNSLPVDSVVDAYIDQVDTLLDLNLDHDVQSRAANDFRFVGIGYDLIKGNPDGQTTGSSHGGTDPGILSTRKILKLVPNSNVVNTPRDACKTVEEIYESTKSYQEKLTREINVAAEASYSGFAFGASAGFQSAGEQTSDSHSLIYEKNKLCFRGSQRYKLGLVESLGSSLTDEFHIDVCALPQSYIANPKAYMDLLGNWGTHVITELDLGHREIIRKKTSTESVLDYAENSYSGAISLSGSYGLASGSVSVDIGSFKSENSFKSLFSSSVTTYTIGSTSLPEPIQLTLKWIKDFLDAKYWSKLSDLQSRNICNGFTLAKLATIKAQMDIAFPQYPGYLNVQKVKDQAILLPLVWPKGTYGLIQPMLSCVRAATSSSENDPCPTGAWEKGYIGQDTEDDQNGASSASPDSQCVSNTINPSNIGLNYCMKMETGGSYRRNWPKGTYCIFKKGTCPNGFTEGSVYWDDEDTRNRNRVSGHMPDGEYGRNTWVYYCCRDDAYTTIQIYLPTEKPFYLVAKNGRFCQQVNGMSVATHEVYWDDEDSGTTDNSVSGSYPFVSYRPRNTGMKFCYYRKN